MGFKDWLEKQRKERESREKLENELKEKVTTLLDKFEIPDFDEFFKNIIGHVPKLEYEDEDRKITKNPLRKEYLDFMWNNLRNNTINFNHIENFAVKRGIIHQTTSILSKEQEKREFERIVDEIKKFFKPEKITNEEHLQSQLSVFLKTKFSDKKTEREKTTESSKPDIVVDDRYAFELKVPKNRAELRNLLGQIDEYLEYYQNLCVVIADISHSEFENGLQIESNLTQNIKEYSEKYMAKYGVRTLIFQIEQRK